jgi:hypothetical protein
MASSTPDIVWHLEPDNQDALVDLFGSFPQSMLAMELVETSLRHL